MVQDQQMILDGHGTRVNFDRSFTEQPERLEGYVLRISESSPNGIWIEISIITGI